MQQYLDLLQAIKTKGTNKPAARPGMPGSKSLFGYQFRFNLSEGFPLLTTKKIYWKAVVIELLWFLRGDTNIKYLIDNGVNIWNEDAYNYYVKLFKSGKYDHIPMEFDDFVLKIKAGDLTATQISHGTNYKLGDCGHQYGKVWRDWHVVDFDIDPKANGDSYHKHIDQIKNLITGLKNNPESRRHIVTAIDPAHDTNLALYWCHAMFQFNCRPLTDNEILHWVQINYPDNLGVKKENLVFPKYYLDCQLYQRSADVVLGVPFNIASYALLIHIVAKMVNMIPGEFIHSFGDVHIYDNHMDAVDEQLKRTPTTLPTLNVNWANNVDIGLVLQDNHLTDFFKSLQPANMILENYNPQESIKAKLSTGLN